MLQFPRRDTPSAMHASFLTVGRSICALPVKPTYDACRSSVAIVTRQRVNTRCQIHALAMAADCGEKHAHARECKRANYAWQTGRLTKWCKFQIWLQASAWRCVSVGLIVLNIAVVQLCAGVDSVLAEDSDNTALTIRFKGSLRPDIRRAQQDLAEAWGERASFKAASSASHCVASLPGSKPTSESLCRLCQPSIC